MIGKTRAAAFLVAGVILISGCPVWANVTWQAWSIGLSLSLALLVLLSIAAEELFN